MTKQAIILAIDTATSACSVAIRVNGVTYERFEVGSNVHSKVLLAMVQSVLQEAQLSVAELDAVAVSQGPGSFTGLRIGVGVAQGIAYGCGCPMIGVSSLETLAWQAAVDGLVIAGIDARMGEIYWCQFLVEDGSVSQLGNAKVSAPADIALSSDALLVGNAWLEYAELLSLTESDGLNVLKGVELPRASASLDFAQAQYLAHKTVAAADFAPIYVRDNVAKKAKSQI
ncbi:tRNA (adenosine(37)-N6)-threonylcarbamoyltransferase complex dimerization subunit type 1 TsaB [Arenicella xantha]|uniref:tRNA threonylcarbamoyladenosine biosynthesis protein TsaB n=1 Tax=Arenicella xantha TaxID=644221 RepID=A0A395JLE7_9GAMM|nr:tRNA (adenosine(37)-N6)-threonylcarbamoyltransferase complex dimerization subunit type 1 TsaB [Arenicella xantha]RBP51616.1 tRNA threonylcarbamoyladenosine biosynthesis protein TsaB [Arenicella xantha]